MIKVRWIGVIMLIISFAYVVRANETCDEVDSIAKTIMTHRQNGVAMKDLIHAIDRVPVNTPAYNVVRKIVESMISLAYEYPMYSTEEFKQQAITDFRNNAYKACMDGMSRE